MGIYRAIAVGMSCWLYSAIMLANDSLPIIEVKADRTMIYPQRMELTGEESLLDVLLMMPELMASGFEDVLDDYTTACTCPTATSR